MTKKKVQLLTYDDDQKVRYSGHCKLRINALSQYLIADPYNEDVKPLSASFDWKYIAEKNILFILSNNNIQSFVLVFADEILCKKVIKSLTKYNANIAKDDLTRKIYYDKLILSLVQKLSDANIKQILIDFVGCYDEEGKKKFFQHLKKNDLYDVFCSKIPVISKEDNLDKSSKPHSSLKHIVANKQTSINNSFPENKKQPTKIRHIICTSKVQVIIKKPKYKLIEANGEMAKRIIVFLDDQKNLCHEYSRINAEKGYLCLGCNSHKKHVGAHLFNLNTKDEYVNLLKNQHVCKPREYRFCSIFKVNYNIIKQPKYELIEAMGNMVKRMIVFTDVETKKFCYEYSWHKQEDRYLCIACKKLKKFVAAAVFHLDDPEKEYVDLFSDKNRYLCRKCKTSSGTVCTDEIGKKYIKLGLNVHKCVPVKYEQAAPIIKSPNFIIFNKEAMNNTTKLIVFTSDDRQMCYRYNFNHFFYCRGCNTKKKQVAAKIFVDSDGNDFILPSSSKHVCQPIKFNFNDYVVC